jgi:hypothetical protein
MRVKKARPAFEKAAPELQGEARWRLVGVLIGLQRAWRPSWPVYEPPCIGDSLNLI